VLLQSELQAIVELPDGDDPSAFGLSRIGSRWSALRAPLADLDALASAHPAWRVTWSAPLRPLLDRAAVWAGAPAFRGETGLTGKGVFVGIVDTGIDVRQPDLRHEDGTTRIAYLVDFGSKAAGLQPDIEAQCSAKGLPCSVYSSQDIDALVRGGRAGQLSRDDVGHGTHVASLAAGNGGLQKKYVGMAPEASIVVARVVDSSNGIGDAGVLAATNLVFWLAEQEGKKQGLSRLPAVVNLSLGSDFGPHDGSSALERGLGDLVGPDRPGRAIVVAAGNSGGLARAETPYPLPLGVHTEVSVPERSSVRVPLVTAEGSGTDAPLKATMYLWIAFRPGDDVRVGVDRRAGPWVPVQPRGVSRVFDDDPSVKATIVNGPLSRLQGQGLEDTNAAVVIIEGTWPRDETFAIRLEGSGTANLWVQSDGDLAPQASPLGALFPAATRESTVTLPAGHPNLIAVGATVNRTDWTDRTGAVQRIGRLAGRDSVPLDSIAFFSSAGPTTDLRMKPDLVAPGAFVVGAMSRDADPQRNPLGIFGEGGFCRPSSDCAVVDATHAVTLGTSMSAPIVTGAIALLLQGDPALTEDRVLTLLQAGARRPNGVTLDAQAGAGALSLSGALDVQRLADPETGGRAAASPAVREPVARESWLTFGQAYAHPDPAWSIPVLLQLRDGLGRAADGLGLSALVVEVDRGAMTHPVERVAPGMFRLSVAADRGTGGALLTLDVRYKGRPFLSESVPVAVDVNVAREGFGARGGCGVAGSQERNPAGAVAALALAFTVWRGRRCNRAARKARSPGQTGNSARGPRGWCPR
jgi:subtilisin family serine protease